MPPQPTIGRQSAWCSWVGRPVSVCQLTPVLHDAMPLCLVEEFQRNLAQMIAIWVGIAEKVFKVTNERSRSRVYKCVSAITAEDYISSVWLWGSLICQINLVTINVRRIVSCRAFYGTYCIAVHRLTYRCILMAGCIDVAQKPNTCESGI